MCEVRRAPLAELVELIASAEFAFEEAFRVAQPEEKQRALNALKRRQDARAVKIFEEYLRPIEKAPLGLDELSETAPVS